MSCTASNGSCVYEIKVSGRIPTGFLERLGSMQIATQSDQGNELTLTGRVRDQAELSGILNTLHELHVSLVSVRQLKGAQE